MDPLNKKFDVSIHALEHCGTQQAINYSINLLALQSNDDSTRSNGTTRGNWQHWNGSRTANASLNTPYYDSEQQYLSNLTGSDGEASNFELVAVPEPYQSLIECLFVLSSILALFFNFSAIFLIKSSHRRQHHNKLQLPNHPNTRLCHFRKNRLSNGQTGRVAEHQGPTLSPRSVIGSAGANKTKVTAVTTPRKSPAPISSSQLRLYLINLFVNDILISLFTTPFTYTDFMYGQWIYPPVLCPISNFVSVCAVSVSVYTLIAIGLER